MQLKTVGESLNALTAIEDVLNASSALGNEFIDNELIIAKLKEATKGYSTEALKMAISQSTVNKECIRAMLLQSGLPIMLTYNKVKNKGFTKSANPHNPRFWNQS